MRGGGRILEFLKNIFLFSGVDDETIDNLSQSVDFEIIKYSRSQSIFTPESYSQKIGFVYEGECEVRCRSAGGKALLNLIKKGESFGILAALGKTEFPTEIYARKNSTVIFMNKDGLISLINSSPKIAMNVISFLADRVAFLNKKINIVTKSNVEKKLASYLISRYKNEGKSSLEFNMKRCSESISVGRCSVYRAIENLKNKGYIEAENKIISILNFKELEKFAK